jgi:hypothetical protein
VDGTASGWRPWAGSGINVTEAAESDTRNVQNRNQTAKKIMCAVLCTE